ncbi:MAG: hypothetical protein R8P61_00010 [Bacteroidia bacterium]|nr:hypothetical protein [Bacteroidia bacterium]
MKQILFFSILLGLFSFQSQAQGPLNKITESRFMQELDSIKIRAEKSVRDFKAIQHLYTEEDVKLVSDSYDASAGLFNNMLLIVKEDLLDKKKRKFIREYPEDYSKQMMADLYQAKIFYETNYMADVTMVTNGQVTGFAWLGTAIMVFELAKEGWAVLQQVKEGWDDLKESAIDNRLIERYRFRLWEEL